MMNYKDLEVLICQYKEGNTNLKEKIVEELMPLAISTAKKTYVQGYTFSDIEHECYLSILKAIEKYNPEKKCFVCYTVHTLKNNINFLIRKSFLNADTNGSSCLILDEVLENTIPSLGEAPEASALHKDMVSLIQKFLKELSPLEVQLVKFIYFENKKLTDYAALNNLSYSGARKRHRTILQKARQFFSKQHIYSLDSLIGI